MLADDVKLIDFQGSDGRQVWENVSDATSLLADADIIRDLDEMSRHRATIDLFTFVLLATYRHQRVQANTVEKMLNRVKYISSINSNVLKVTLCKRRRALQFDHSVRSEPLFIGQLDGITAVFPIKSKECFDEFAESNKQANSLDENYILVGGRDAVPHPYLYIGGVVHLPSLATRRQPSNSSAGVLHALFRHLGSLIPPLRYDKQQDQFFALSGGDLPKILCIRDERAMADVAIRGMGFSPTGAKTVLGDEKFLLDLTSYNERTIGELERRKIRRAFFAVRRSQLL